MPNVGTLGLCSSSRTHRRAQNAETPPERGFRDAAEWSRTITGVSTVRGWLAQDLAVYTLAA